MTEVKIVALVGSLRVDSVSAATSRAAIAAAPDGVSIEPYDLSDVPLYNGDVEAAGLPAAVQGLHDKVGPAHGLLMFSPEYNGSFPAVTKNAIDWMTRPPKAWEGTAISLVVTTPGPRAGVSIRTHCDAIMEFQPVHVFESLGIGSYGEKLEAGEIVDPATLTQLATHVANFADFCRSV